MRRSSSIERDVALCAAEDRVDGKPAGAQEEQHHPINVLRCADEFDVALALERDLSAKSGWSTRVVDNAIAEDAVREGIVISQDRIVFKDMPLIIHGDLLIRGEMAA